MQKETWLMDVDQTTFDQDVVARSHDVPVLVDFWAPWCGPCRTLGPILENVVMEMAGRCLLAKVNSDQNQSIAKQYHVRGIPAVKLFVKGAVVDEFTGALPERAVRQFLERALPSPRDRLAQQADECLERGQEAQARTIYADILAQDPMHVPALMGMTRLLLKENDPAAAHTLFERLPRQAIESPEGKRLHAQLTFAGETDGLEPWARKVADHPQDLEARLALGRGLVKTGHYEEGMEQFLEVVRQDKTFQEAAGRKALLQVFDLLGPAHPSVALFRAKLSALLFA